MIVSFDSIKGMLFLKLGKCFYCIWVSGSWLLAKETELMFFGLAKVGITK